MIKSKIMVKVVGLLDFLTLTQNVLCELERRLCLLELYEDVLGRVALIGGDQIGAGLEIKSQSLQTNEETFPRFLCSPKESEPRSPARRGGSTAPARPW